MPDDVRPVKADARRLFLHALAALQGAEVPWNSVETALALSPGFFQRLELLPIAPLRVHVFDHGVAEDVRMTPYHLVRECVDDVGDAELSDLRRELRVKENLQEQVAELFAECIELLPFDRFDDLERFLDQIRHQRAVRLLAIPRATHTQPRHDLHEIVPRVVRRLRRQRDERHRDRGGERRSRHAGNDLGSDAAGLEQPQQRRQAGKIRERIAEHAQPDGVTGEIALQPLGESLDLVAAAAHEKRGIVDEIADDRDAVAFDR